MVCHATDEENAKSSIEEERRKRRNFQRALRIFFFFMEWINLLTFSKFFQKFSLFSRIITREKLTSKYSFKNITDEIDLIAKYLEDIIVSRLICIAINWYILYIYIYIRKQDRRKYHINMFCICLNNLLRDKRLLHFYLYLIHLIHILMIWIK